MRRHYPSLPSPAMAVALTALFVALGGTGYAATQLHAAAAKNPRATGAKKSKKKKKTTTTTILVKCAATTVVCKGTPGPTGQQGPTGPQGAGGAAGSPGAPGTALGYARVNSDGTVIAAASKGVATANVTKVGTAGYCFHGLSFTPGSAVASADFNGTPSDASAQVELPASSASFLEDTFCPAGTQAFVFTQASNAASAQPFYVIFT